MVAKEFLDLYNSISAANRFTFEDFADRLNLLTAVLFLVSCLLISTKQYLLSAIACYIPVKPTGENFGGYLTDYCWVHGTIPLRSDEKMPQTVDDWVSYDNTRRITYYQWVPFILGLQCIMFYIPHILWQSVCSNRSGGDLFNLMKSASGAAIENRATRAKSVTRVAEFLEDMLGEHVDCRKGRRANMARKAYDKLGLLVVSKRLGTRLVVSYLLVKLFTIVNAVVQIALIQRFLGFYSGGSASRESMGLGHDDYTTTAADQLTNNDNSVSGFHFGWKVLRLLLQGKDWPETLLFPRVAHCYVGDIRLIGVKNTYTAQCALPVNMLNEKIYIFFWFWIVFLIATTIYSLFKWIFRIASAARRQDFITRFLRLKKIASPSGLPITREDLNQFINEYLRRDGVFLVRMVALNAGEVMASSVVECLYEHYAGKYDSIDEKPKLDDLKIDKA